MDMTQLLLAVNGAMFAILAGVIAWCWTGLSRKVDMLSMHREDCIRQFADKLENMDDHRRIWKAVETITTQGHGHEIRIDALEQRLKEKR